MLERIDLEKYVESPIAPLSVTEKRKSLKSKSAPPQNKEKGVVQDKEKTKRKLGIWLLNRPSKEVLIEKNILRLFLTTAAFSHWRVDDFDSDSDTDEDNSDVKMKKTRRKIFRRQKVQWSQLSCFDPSVSETMPNPRLGRSRFPPFHCVMSF